MMRLAGANVLIVPPFECAWLMGDEARFAEPGKGCVAFEAMTENDVTVVFKELAGCKHYRTDFGPSYTFILGSHRNRRLKIEVDGRTVADIDNVTVQPAHFGHYWINVYDGVLTVGKGDPGKGVIYQWVDSKPNCNIQYVGLSSWDKHVVYRNIKVLPPLQPPRKFPMPHDSGGFAQFLESEDLADLQIIVGPEERIVSAHKLVLALCCTKFLDLCTTGVVHMPLVQYQTLHSLLQYVYTGKTEVHMKAVHDLADLAERFGLQQLVSQCQELEEGISADSEDDTAAGDNPCKVDVILKICCKVEDRQGSFLSQLPVDLARLSNLLQSGDYSDVKLSVDGHSQVVRAHKLILSAWSHPFAKMFTNGMRESQSDDVLIQDVCLEPLLAMINFMYTGHLELDRLQDMGSTLLPLLILADQFAMQFLQQECIDCITDSLTKDSVCAVFQVVETMPMCQALFESCTEMCAKHFNFYTTLPALEFQQLEASCLQKILQHPDLRVTSEEKVLDAVIFWATRKDGMTGWQDAIAYLDNHEEESFSADQLRHFGILLPLVRFPLMSGTVLQQLESSSLIRHIPVLKDLVLEALEYLGQNLHSSTQKSEVLPVVDSKNFRLVRVPKSSLRFTPRPSAFRELQYIRDGDCNGVFYHIGTSHGLHSWMNPVLTKRVTVTASSPPARFSDAKALVSHAYQGTCFAGPCLEGGHISSWWKVDLGNDHQLMCNYYTVRQDGSTNFMRSWKFQGSGDGDSWTELRSHENDQTICQPGQYASWPVTGARANLPFRYFRIILTTPTTSSMNPWNFCICYLEFYGYFH